MPLGPRPIRPDGIRYWIDARPPLPLSLLLAIQQIAFLGSIMTLPVVLGRAANVGATGEANLVALTMISAGIGVMLQALNRYGIGSGLFAPTHTSSAAFPAALSAVKVGGLGLAFGMMAAAGLVQVLTSRAMPRLRALFPVEIAGLTVFMMGLGLGLVGLKSFLGIDAVVENHPTNYGVGFFTLAVIVFFNIWAGVLGRSFSVFAGLVAGQCLAYSLGLVSPQSLANLQHADVFAVPELGRFGWSLDWRLLPDFIIVGLALSFNNFGVMTIAQRANDAGWKRPDMNGIGRGLLAEGLTNILASLLNGVTQTASGGAVGLSQASGITSRIVAFVLGGLFILLAFFPPVPMLWSTLSPAVIGAVLIFVGSFITIGGLKILTSRLLDNRKIIMLGVAIIVGLGHDTLMVKIDIPSALAPMFATSLSVTVLTALALNAIFRLGSKKRLEHEVVLGNNWHQSVNQLIWHLGHQWGARPEVVSRLDHATNELIDVIHGQHLLDGQGPQSVNIATRFDEYGCTLELTYRGVGVELPLRRPDPEQLLESPEAVGNMGGYVIRRLADNVKVTSSDGKVTVMMHFND